ncbi:MAG: AgmX/PglI C-terminal domain-containing protein [Pseudomonadota bacterium]
MSPSNPKDGGLLNDDTLSDRSFDEEIERADRILGELDDLRETAGVDLDELHFDVPQNTDISDDERVILEEISRSEAELDDLEGSLRAAYSELAALEDKRSHYEALIRVCEAVERLDTLEAGDLFWGENGAERQNARLEHARRQLEQFDAEIEAAERKRESVLAKIDEQNLELDSLDTHLRDAMEREERSRAEWIVENEVRELAHREQVMPWTRREEEDKRFRQALAAAVLIGLLLGWLLPMIDLPIPLRDKLTEVPDRVANVIRQDLPEPEPVAPVPEPVVEELPPEPVEPEEQLVEEVAETPTEQPAVAAEVEQPGASETAQPKGILAFRESFATASLDRPNARLGSQARVRSAGETSVGRPERAMVTTSAPGSSGGINLSDISRDVGGGGPGIEGVQVSQVASTIGTGEGPDRPLSAGLTAGRTDEEIQIVFDRYKAALYRLYNRELRRDPTLRGQIVLTLTIEPDGSVSMCEVQSSNMNAPALAEQVVNRVRGFDFGAKEDIAAVTIVYPIDFLPAG